MLHLPFSTKNLAESQSELNHIENSLNKEIKELRLFNDAYVLSDTFCRNLLTSEQNSKEQLLNEKGELNRQYHLMNSELDHLKGQLRDAKQLSAQIEELQVNLF